ncbi:MAG TPA: ATP-binding protein [Actinomycetales bacterium]|nr:ATP-binding protein [Actinomycetales bacterium]
MQSTVSVPAKKPPRGESLGEWPLRPDVRSARLARRLVSQAMDGVGEALKRRAALITSELVSNGVRHARGGLVLQVLQLRRGIVVAVADDSAAPPVVRPAGRKLVEDGRGLLIVERISDELGWARTPTGKVVWASVLDED